MYHYQVKHDPQPTPRADPSFSNTSEAHQEGRETHSHYTHDPTTRVVEQDRDNDVWKGAARWKSMTPVE